jgi:hypothetical protein
MSSRPRKRTTLPVAVVGLVSLVGFIFSRYLLINTKDSVVDQTEFLGSHTNPPEIYGHPSTGLLYSPLNVHLAPMDRLILVDFADDPDYSSIELQVFDDARGRGARVLLYHKVGPADYYYTSRVFADVGEPDAASVIPEMEYRFDVTASGLNAELKMKDREGKSVEFQVNEAPHKKDSKGFLAPVGGSNAVTFDYFPFFHMKGMAFVRRSDSEVAIKIGGQNRTPSQIPTPVNWKLVYLSRYTTAPILGQWNKAHNDQLPAMRPGLSQAYQDGETCYELVNNAGHYEIHKMIGFNDKDNVSFEFSPAIPDLPGLKEGIELSGRFSAGANEVLGIVAGEYHIKRHGATINMEILPLDGYQPNPGTLWVKTWTWKSAMTVAVDGTVSMKSEWTRNG